MANEAKKQVKSGETNSDKPLRATHGSPSRPLKIGNAEIPAYVLSNEMRILSGRGLQGALAPGQKRSDILKNFLTDLLSKPGTKDIAHGDLLQALENPVRFIRPGRGGKLATGYEATILADICSFVLEARYKGILKTKYGLRIADECEILQRGFAKVGIIALVDEVTGYQDDRDSLALQKFPDAYLQPYAATWAKRSPIVSIRNCLN